MINMQAAAEKAAEFDNDLVRINREIKRLASIKTRLKKQINRASFNESMTVVLQEEQLLKNARDLVQGPRKNVNTVTQLDVDNMTITEVIKAIKAIQSKKTHTKWLTTEPGANDEYREACRIETMLKARRDELLPKTSNSISKYELQQILDMLSVYEDLTTEECINKIKQFTEV